MSDSDLRLPSLFTFAGWGGWDFERSFIVKTFAFDRFEVPLTVVCVDVVAEAGLSIFRFVMISRAHSIRSTHDLNSYSFEYNHWANSMRYSNFNHWLSSDLNKTKTIQTKPLDSSDRLLGLTTSASMAR